LWQVSSFILVVAGKWFYFSRGRSVALFQWWQVNGFILVVVDQLFYFSRGRLVVLF
jgi:hypothetical protein